MMDRRELIHRAAMLLGGAVSASAMAGVLAGCVSTPDAGEMTTFLNDEEKRTVTAMAEQIIPRTDTPGATDAGVPGFIDKMLAGYYQDKERTRIRAGLAQVATDAAELHGKPFADLSAAEQVAMMKRYDQAAYSQPAGSDPHFFRTVKELTIIGYCTSEAGATKLLKYTAVPGPYRGDIPYSEVGRAWQS